MIDEVTVPPPRSDSTRETRSDADLKAADEVREARASSTRELRTLRARFDAEVPPLMAALERVDREREKANEAYQAVRRRWADARQVLANVREDLQREIQRLEVELIATAPLEFAGLRTEFLEGWQQARSRTADYHGIRFGDATLEGQGLLAKAFIRGIERAEALMFDGDIVDPGAAVTVLRHELLEEAKEIVKRHARDRTT